MAKHKGAVKVSPGMSVAFDPIAGTRDVTVSILTEGGMNMAFRFKPKRQIDLLNKIEQAKTQLMAAMKVAQAQKIVGRAFVPRPASIFDAKKKGRVGK